ncbi:acyltransferase family protein [Candidatus Williamhamiltonella defendens]|uniref:Acyltransferase n=1 Tax=Hamiltonella defensa subsp. Acyrthosiphon pisum (strain 5AT) TaxID=572265 RepID=C4K4K5_HAMD5|nr:putative acyltransferase [Candidatus Hamiltonella defensa 5AT (Acyrthosiphon pisum)]ATW22211.1 hypothetical protein BJP44_03525 [Candidatus Hamiltonella defensa]
MVKSIHYLRGISALFVLFFHYRFMLNNVYSTKNLGDILFSSGYFGVDLFFMISGFIIVYSTKNNNSIFSFSVKRLFKIYPVYLFCLALHIAVVFPYVSIEIIKSLFFLQINYNNNAPFYGYSTIYPAWTLTYEFIFYMFFLIGLKISHRYRTLVTSVIMLFVYAYLNIKYNGFLTLNPNHGLNFTVTNRLQGLIKNMASPLMIEFILGMITCEIFMRTRANNKILISICSIMFYSSLCIFFYYVFVDIRGHGILRIGFPCFLILFSSVILEKVNEVKENKYLNLLGNISYPLYLTHTIVLALISSNSAYFTPYIQLVGFGRLIFVTFFAILLSYLTHVLIEVNASKLGRVIIDKFRARSAL